MIQEQNIHRVFEIGIILKGLNALAEIIGGIAIYLISTEFVLWITNLLTFNELSEDPNDLLASFLLSSAASFTIGSKTFIALYLLSHGLIKGFLVLGLLRDKLWAYPASLIAFGLFIVYQLYRFTHTHSIGLILITIFDLVILWLIWHEYQLLRKNRSTQSETV